MPIKPSKMKNLKRNKTEREPGSQGAREIISRFAIASPENSGVFRRRFFKFSVGVLVTVSALMSFSCKPNERVLKSSPVLSPTPFSTAPPKETSVEQEVRSMQDVDFDYIFVLRRRDGGAFDSEDRKFLRENMPAETNRRVFSDGEKAFIIGTAFKFPPENMEALRGRFIVEDFSKPEKKEPETNSQTNKQTNQEIKQAKPQENRK